MNLAWTPAASGKTFTFYEGTAPGTGKPVRPDTITGASALVTGLTNGTTYYFWLAVGTSPTAVSNTALAIPAGVMAPIGPGPPARASATHKVCLAADAGNAQVNMTWTPAASGKTFTFYEGTAPGTGKPVRPDTVTDTGALVTGLTNGTTYYFWLAVGTSPTAVSNTALAIPVGPPGPPAGLTAIPGNAQVTLSWTAPASTGGLPVSGYLIYKGTSPGSESGTPVTGSPVTGTGYTVTGLTNGTTYYFKVLAINAAGLSPPSGEASAALPPTGPSSTGPSSTGPSSTGPAFGPPTGLAATAGDTQVRLSWTAPASAGGSPVVTYKIYVATTPGVPGRAAAGGAKSTDATVTHLPNGTVYYFMVTAVNAAGKESPFSTQVSAKPAGSATGVQVGLNSPATPIQLIALLAAVAAMGAAGLFTLITRRGRRSRSPAHTRSARTRARSRQPVAVPSDVRAVPGISRPDVLDVRNTGQEPTHTIRLEPHPGVATTTFKGRRP